VKPSSGRLGVVVEQSPQSLLVPRVKVFFSTKSKIYLPPEIIDLARQPAEKSSAVRMRPRGASSTSIASGRKPDLLGFLPWFALL
jgi:hypothetical protein